MKISVYDENIALFFPALSGFNSIGGDVTLSGKLDRFRWFWSHY
jgi:hypothetical protein